MPFFGSARGERERERAGERERKRESKKEIEVQQKGLNQTTWFLKIVPQTLFTRTTVLFICLSAEIHQSFNTYEYIQSGQTQTDQTSRSSRFRQVLSVMHAVSPWVKLTLVWRSMWWSWSSDVMIAVKAPAVLRLTRWTVIFRLQLCCT